MTNLTTAAGAPVVDNENTMIACPRGPLWLLGTTV
jgi:catalase